MTDVDLTAGEYAELMRSLDELPPCIRNGLETAQRLREKVLAHATLAVQVSEILPRFPEAKADMQIDWFGDLSLSCTPAMLTDMKGLLRELRRLMDRQCEPSLHPDGSYINYRIGRLTVTVHLNRQCRFKQTGTRTVEQPVYEIECDGEAQPTLQEAQDVCHF